jgi:hypothetical protein
MARSWARYGAVMAALVVLLAGGWVVLAPWVWPAARAQDAPRPAVRWEYCSISDDQTGKCAFTSAREAAAADSFKELAQKLKVPLKDGEENDWTIRVALFDFLGGQGWELASHSGMSSNTAFLETFVFKRRLEK